MERSAAPAGLKLFGVLAAGSGVISMFPLLSRDTALALAYGLGGVATCIGFFAFARVVEVLEDIRESVLRRAGDAQSSDPVREEARAAVGLK